jgi:ABC-type multidrug transport system permease subunit
MARVDFRERYGSVYIVAGELLGMGLGLTIYWFTARAFSPVFGTDYFTFVVVGELATMVPMQLFAGLAAAMRSASAQGTLDAMLALPVRPQTPALLFAASTLPRDFLRIAITLIVSIAIFGLKAPLSGLLGLFALQLAALPAFLGLALLVTGLIVTLGRGSSVLGQVGTAATALAGAYFPTSVLPPAIEKFLVEVSPFNSLVTATRAVLGQAAGAAIAAPCLKLVIGGALLLPLGYAVMGFGLARLRRVGNPLLA